MPRISLEEVSHMNGNVLDGSPIAEGSLKPVQLTLSFIEGNLRSPYSPGLGGVDDMFSQKTESVRAVDGYPHLLDEQLKQIALAG